MIRICIVLCLQVILFSACRYREGETEEKTHCVKQESLPLKYAKGFSVDYYSGFKVVTVRDWRDEGKTYEQYILMDGGKGRPLDFPEAVIIDTPVRKIVCISTNHVAEMIRMGLIDSIGGLANVSLLYNRDVAERIRDGKIKDLGTDELNYEKIMELNPSFVFTSGSWEGGDRLKVKLDALHVNSVLNLDYMEQEPLARAEWIKFIAVFYGLELEADSIFNQIEDRYLSLKEKAANVNRKPTVFLNLPFKEVWYMPCGENYMAKLLTDAGADFLWNDASATNGLNLNLDYEAVYNRAAEAEYWLNVGFARSREEIKSADRKNGLFYAYKNDKVFNNDRRNTPSGGFDFWESGVVNPDKILADLIFIFHPDLLPNHQLYYYRKLD